MSIFASLLALLEVRTLLRIAVNLVVLSVLYYLYLHPPQVLVPAVAVLKAEVIPWLTQVAVPWLWTMLNQLLP